MKKRKDVTGGMKTAKPSWVCHSLRNYLNFAPREDKVQRCSHSMQQPNHHPTGLHLKYMFSSQLETQRVGWSLHWLLKLNNGQISQAKINFPQHWSLHTELNYLCRNTNMITYWLSKPTQPCFMINKEKLMRNFSSTQFFKIKTWKVSLIHHSVWGVLFLLCHCDVFFLLVHDISVCSIVVYPWLVHPVCFLCPE